MAQLSVLHAAAAGGGIPADLYKAADIDGAGPLSQLRLIALPMLRRIIAAAVILRIIGLVNSPDVLLILSSGGPGRSTMVQSRFAFQTACRDFNFGYAGALSVVMFVLLRVFARAYVRLVKVNQDQPMPLARSRSNLIWNGLSHVVLIALSFLCIAPIVRTFIMSIKPETDIVTSTLTHIPSRVTFETYVKLWQQSGYPLLILNSLVVTSVTVLICFLTGTTASYAFSRYSFRGRTRLMLGYLVVRMFPAVLMIIPLFVVMRMVGLLDSRVGLAIAYTSFLLPLLVWMLKGFFDAAPREAESAARIDGSTRIGAMFARDEFPARDTCARS